MTAERDPAAIQVDAVRAMLADQLGDDLQGLYLYGSAVLGGLQPRSDIDLLVLCGRSLDPAAKRAVVDRLLEISVLPSRRGPERVGERPLEVTILARPEIEPWRYPARMELQYGEWLRSELEAGPLDPEPIPSPDLAVLIESVRRDGRTLVGRPPRAALPFVPSADLARAMLDGVDSLLAELEPDTTNVLLTLARMWFTLATGDIAPKDLAAEWAMTHLGKDDRSVLDQARALYLGETAGSWRDTARVAQAAQRLAVQVRRAGEGAGHR